MSRGQTLYDSLSEFLARRDRLLRAFSDACSGIESIIKNWPEPLPAKLKRESIAEDRVAFCVGGMRLVFDLVPIAGRSGAIGGKGRVSVTLFRTVPSEIDGTLLGSFEFEPSGVVTAPNELSSLDLSSHGDATEIVLFYADKALQRLASRVST